MSTYLLIFVAALVLAIAMTPVAKQIAARTGTVDLPASRKLHRNPVPLLGGAAMYIAFVVAVLAFGDRFGLPQLLGILLGATLVSLAGVWDDRRGVPPLLKLGAQVAAAAILIASGVQVDLLPNPTLNWALTLIWIVGITNAFNLLDNMDGLSGGVAAVAAAFFLVLAAGSGQVLVASLSAALLGACLGFLRYNWNPASIFMGDTGSLFIGLLLAAVGIKLKFPAPASITWMVPIAVLGVPILDTTLVTISRLRRGLNPLTTPGKDHISHRLARTGLSHREVVMAIYLIAVACGIVALLISQSGFFEAYGIAATLLVAGGLAVWRLERIPAVDQPVDGPSYSGAVVPPADVTMAGQPKH